MLCRAHVCRPDASASNTELAGREASRRARRIVGRDAREISLAELSRRGLEYILSVYAPEPGAGGEWQPPKTRRLGWKGLTDAQIKAQAQLTANEAAATLRRKK